MPIFRTRFAPSPTGDFHLGGLRVLLFNQLYSLKYNGEMIFRIDDTDRTRFNAGSLQQLDRMMDIFGIKYSRRVLQSERTKTYQQSAQQLLSHGYAYQCNCTQERLQRIRDQALQSGQIPTYDRKCRLSSVDAQQQQSPSPIQDKVSTIRLKVPLSNDQNSLDIARQLSQTRDLMKGKLKIQLKDLDDSILLKADGNPTYHLANAVDDQEFGISHVIRGEEWFSSLPKHIILSRYLSAVSPSSTNKNSTRYAHLPLLMNRNGTKLSKRSSQDGSGMGTIQQLLSDGYYPQVLAYFALTLGMNQQYVKNNIPLIYQSSLSDFYQNIAEKLVDIDNLRDVFSGKNCVVDPSQLGRLNQSWLMQMAKWDSQSLVKEIDNTLDAAYSQFDDHYKVKVFNLLVPQVRTMQEFKMASSYFFRDPQLNVNQLTQQIKVQLPETRLYIEKLMASLSSTKLKDYSSFERAAQELGVDSALSKRVLRWALTGQKNGEALRDILDLLPEDTIRKRLENAHKMLMNRIE
ncbi:hypothetical protein MIR68_008894 [Amoeboaphelidium protococcarum]|nr:hypothetical protein MIR68_008894 [Amoeboaphelidium protococcarum]